MDLTKKSGRSRPKAEDPTATTSKPSPPTMLSQTFETLLDLEMKHPLRLERGLTPIILAECRHPTARPSGGEVGKNG
jgi:hypothetical protein